MAWNSKLGSFKGRQTEKCLDAVIRNKESIYSQPLTSNRTVGGKTTLRGLQWKHCPKSRARDRSVSCFGMLNFKSPFLVMPPPSSQLFLVAPTNSVSPEDERMNKWMSKGWDFRSNWLYSLSSNHRVFSHLPLPFAIQITEVSNSSLSLFWGSVIYICLLIIIVPHP